MSIGHDTIKKLLGLIEDKQKLMQKEAHELTEKINIIKEIESIGELEELPALPGLSYWVDNKLEFEDRLKALQSLESDLLQAEKELLGLLEA
jgi:Na+/phosphate symporter